MEARFFITPRAGEGDYMNEREVTEQVLGSPSVSQRAERNKWNYGVASSGSVTLKLADQTGEYGSQRAANSVFAIGGADGAKLRIAMPTEYGGSEYLTVWRGLLTTKATRRKPRMNESDLIFRSPEVALQEAALSPGAIAAGSNLTQIFNAILNIPAVDGAITGAELSIVDPTTAGITVANELALLGEARKVPDVLGIILKSLDCLLSYSADSGKIFVFTRGAIPQTDTYPEITHPINIEETDDGGSRVYNQFTVKHSAGTEQERVLENHASISTYGLRAETANAQWIGGAGEAREIANFLLERLSFPKRLISLEVGAWDIPLRLQRVGQGLRLRIPAAVPMATPRVGGARVGGNWKLPQPRYGRFDGVFFIEEIDRKIKTDTLIIQAREV